MQANPVLPNIGAAYSATFSTAGGTQAARFFCLGETAVGTQSLVLSF